MGYSRSSRPGSLLAFAVSLAICGLAVSPCWSQEPAAEAQLYVCLPCGLACDKVTHSRPGSCPDCGMPLVPQASVTRVAILVFEGVQIIDFTGPYEVFGQAGFRVETVGPSTDPIRTAMGLTIVPEHDFTTSIRPDIVVVPGGHVHGLYENQPAIDWLRKTAADARVVLSVCNGAFLLAHVGLLDGLEATTFAGLIDDLAAEAPQTRVVSDRRFVDNGKIVTSAGLSSGIDAALHVVEKILGRGRAQMVATTLEYNWDPESKYVRAALADRQLSDLNRMVRAAGADIDLYQGGTDRWETRWRLSGLDEAQELVERMRQKLLEQKRWSLIRSTSENGERVSEWTFSDDHGASWNGLIRLQVSDHDGPHQLILSVKRR